MDGLRAGGVVVEDNCFGGAGPDGGEGIERPDGGKRPEDLGLGEFGNH
jgi:hypothetical protein